MKISMDKKYKTKSGIPVTILMVDLKGSIYPVVAVAPLKGNNGEIVLRYDINGCTYYGGSENELDLVEISKYGDLKIDDKVLVWDDDSSTKVKRHFAGISDTGKPMAYQNGKTSFTNYDILFSWDNCELYVDNK